MATLGGATWCDECPCERGPKETPYSNWGHSGKAQTCSLGLGESGGKVRGSPSSRTGPLLRTPHHGAQRGLHPTLHGQQARVPPRQHTHSCSCCREPTWTLPVRPAVPSLDTDTGCTFMSPSPVWFCKQLSRAVSTPGLCLHHHRQCHGATVAPPTLAAAATSPTGLWPGRHLPWASHALQGLLPAVTPGRGGHTQGWVRPSESRSHACPSRDPTNDGVFARAAEARVE